MFQHRLGYAPVLKGRVGLIVCCSYDNVQFNVEILSLNACFNFALWQGTIQGPMTCRCSTRICSLSFRC